MSAIVAKVVLAPMFVVAASLAARRFGPRVGGLIGGLPVVAGPILLVFALGHGPAFGARAAAGTLLGIVSLSTFLVVYARLAGRASWAVGLLAGWGGFFAMTATLDTISIGAGAALAVVLVALWVTQRGLPRPREHAPSEFVPPAWDLPLRALSALALVLALTAFAGRLGPQLSGLLAPFPVIASVLAVFTHTQHGEQHLLQIVRGFATGLVAYALFCFVLAVSLESLGIASGFALATVCALAIQSAMLGLTRRAHGSARRLSPAHVWPGADEHVLSSRGWARRAPQRAIFSMFSWSRRRSRSSTAAGRSQPRAQAMCSRSEPTEHGYVTYRAE